MTHLRFFPINLRFFPIINWFSGPFVDSSMSYEIVKYFHFMVYIFLCVTSFISTYKFMQQYVWSDNAFNRVGFTWIKDTERSNNSTRDFSFITVIDFLCCKWAAGFSMVLHDNGSVIATIYRTRFVQIANKNGNLLKDGFLVPRLKFGRIQPGGDGSPRFELRASLIQLYYIYVCTRNPTRTTIIFELLPLD